MDETYRIIQNQIMLFNLVGALYYELTGVIPTVSTNINKDEKVIAYPDLSAISSQGESLQYSCQPEKVHDRHSQPVGISGAS